jgi:Arc/MetJ-type ribon-helix-helix transcriptional regulator
MKRDRVLSVKLPDGVINELDRLVNIEGMFFSKSDALRHGARLTILLSKDYPMFNQIKKKMEEAKI